VRRAAPPAEAENARLKATLATRTTPDKGRDAGGRKRRLRKALALAQQGFENNASPPCACRLIISTRPR